MDGTTFSVTVPEGTSALEIKLAIGTLREVQYETIELFFKGNEDPLTDAQLMYANGLSLFMLVKPLIEIFAATNHYENGITHHSFRELSIYTWLCKAARAGLAEDDSSSGEFVDALEEYLGRTHTDFYGLQQLFDCAQCETESSRKYREVLNGNMAAYCPCTEAEWPQWFEKNVYTERSAVATENSLMVSTDDDEGDVVYALATTLDAALKLLESGVNKCTWMANCSGGDY